MPGTRRKEPAVFWGGRPEGFILLLHVAGRPDCGPHRRGSLDVTVAKLQVQDVVGPGPAGQEGPRHAAWRVCVCVCVCTSCTSFSLRN